MNGAFSKHTSIKRNLGKLGLSVSALALGAHDASAQALCADGSTGPVCQIDNTGVSGPIFGANGTATVISNSGTIAGTPAIALGNSFLLGIDNKAGGLIDGNGGVAISVPRPSLSFYLRNAGTINGDVVYSDSAQFLQFSGATNAIYISDGGTLNGNLTLGSTTANNPGAFQQAIFLQRGATTGVTGTISAGNGMDVFAKSYTGTQTLTLGSEVLPATFEIAGYEALGTDTVLTLSAPTDASAPGFSLLGEGSVVVNGEITRPSTAGAGFPSGATVVPLAVSYVGTPGVTTAFVTPLPSVGPNGQQLFYGVNIGGGLKSFTNNGTIGGDIRITTASFTNAGTLALETRSPGTVITAKSNTDFVFNNTGTISQTYNGARIGVSAPGVPPTNGLPGNPGGAETQLDFDTTAAVRLENAPDAAVRANVRIANSGSISGGLRAQLIAKDFVFENTGTLSGINQSDFGAPGVEVLLGERRLVMPGIDDEMDADSATITNAANAVINDGAGFELATNRMTFRNDGTINASTLPEAEGMALLLEQFPFEDDGSGVPQPDAASFGFVNSGTIAGSVNLDFEGTAATILNSGTVTRELLAIDQNLPPLFGNREAFLFENESGGDQTLVFTNTGRIESKDRGSSGVIIELDSGNDEPEDGAPVTVGSAKAQVTNSGAIVASGGALLTPGVFLGYPQQSNTLVFSQVAALFVDGSDSNGGSEVTIENQASGSIVASGNLNIITRNQQTGAWIYQTPPNATDGMTVAVAAAADKVTIVNSGLIQGTGGSDYSQASNVIVEADGEQPYRYLAGAIHLGGYQNDDDSYRASTDLVRNTATGEIVGSIDLGEGDDVLDNFGKIRDVTANGANVFLRGGNDTFVNRAGSLFEGVADGGDGIDTTVFELDGSMILNDDVRDRFWNFERTEVGGSGVVQTTTGFSVTSGGSLTLAADSVINLLPNTDTPDIPPISGSDAGETLVNFGSIAGDIALGGGADSLSNYGSITGNVDLGDGDDTLIHDIDALFSGIADGGAGIDTLKFDITGSTVPITDQLRAQFINFEIETLIGQGTVITDNEVKVGDGEALELDEDSVIDVGPGQTAISGGDQGETVTNKGNVTGNVDLGNGDNQFTNGGNVTGNVATGSGADIFTNTGTVTGNVDLGGGDDQMIIRDGAAFGGTVSGGSGNNQLVADTSGTYQNPTQINGSQFTQFESFNNQGGTTQLSGNLDSNVNVNGGYFYGTQGSTIAGNVNIGNGAQFGTSGTVDGNVAVGTGGTLAPGSSPGVMTVTGNLSLAAGTTAVFEFVPAPGQSDQLLISGALTIGANATLTMTGNRPLTPGVNYDLIVADGGITGTFANVNQPSTIEGYLTYSANRLTLLGTFLTPTTLTYQQEAAVDYTNAVLVSGEASGALLAAVPSLLAADGSASGAAFNLLTAEAYAGASQLAIDNGLSVVTVGRTGIARTDREEAGLFAFAQGLGDNRTLKANAAIGTSRAKSESYGVLGGFGYGTGNASAAVFIGRIDAKQRISALGARTDADGMVAGLAAHFKAAGFEFNLMGAYLWADADTTRGVVGGTVDSSEYKLRNFVLDASVGYSVPVGADWAVRPEIGITHMNVRRGATMETGSAAFGLDVDSDRLDASFVDGRLTLKGGQSDGAVFHPWGQVGVRHQLKGEIQSASAGFVGTTSRFSVFGAGRKETVLTAGAGFGYDLGQATLYAGYQGEFGGGNGHTANVGVRISF